MVSQAGVPAPYSVCHHGSGGRHQISSHVSEEGLKVAISVVAQVPGLKGREDATLVDALDLEGSPPAGEGPAWTDRRAAAGP